MQNKVKEKVQILFANDFSGHDYFHTERVYRNAMAIAKQIPCDEDVVALASLLHDADDPKLFTTENNQNARRIMAELNIPKELAEEVISIINMMSFNGTGKSVPHSIEGKIVQDADWLDALGAMGIARAFAYGGSRNRPMYDPDVLPNLDHDEVTYRSNNGTTINHFYEKLLLLKDLMNTDAARKIAEARTEVMREYLDEFIKEWNGEK